MDHNNVCVYNFSNDHHSISNQPINAALEMTHVMVTQVESEGNFWSFKALVSLIDWKKQQFIV